MKNGRAALVKRRVLPKYGVMVFCPRFHSWSLAVDGTGTGGRKPGRNQRRETERAMKSERSRPRRRPLPSRARSMSWRTTG